MVHMSYRSFLFISGWSTYQQAQKMAENKQLVDKSCCGQKVIWFDGTIEGLKKMMWVGPDRNPHWLYGEKVTCPDCIKILKENEL